MTAVLLSVVLSLVLTLVGTRLAIAWLQRHGFGQPIRQDGPTTHLVKRGIPTMGGVVIVAMAIVSYLVAILATGGAPTASGWLLMIPLVGCALIGFLDDFIKVYQQDNRGLAGRWKMVGQAVLAIVFGLLATTMFANEHGVHPASLALSTTQDWIKLPLVVVLVLIWFIITGTSNATNLTDGADGLLACIAAMVFAAYGFINFFQWRNLCGKIVPGIAQPQCFTVRDPHDLAVFSVALAGACIGFLWWNAKPARIIMGDVGSLAIGGAVAGLAIMSRTEVLMAIIAGVFVMETLSVMLQVSYFKITKRLTGTGKRIFRITPIHHHFEHLGWSEENVVLRFWVIAGVCVTTGLAIFLAAWSV